MAMIFVDSNIFKVFYLGSLFNIVTQMSHTMLEMIAVIKPCSSMIQTQTTKEKKQDNKLGGLQLTKYVKIEFLLIF